MATLPIVKLPHSVLHRQAEPVPAGAISSPRIKRMILDMKDTLGAARDGVGLAAPQVGAGLRIFLVSEEAMAIDAATGGTGGEGAKKAWAHWVFINPVLKKRSRTTLAMAEGCLSLPGKFGEVARAEKVSLEWRDEAGAKHERGFRGFVARVIQHELDHLEGMLISDRAKKLVAIPASKERPKS